MKALALLPLSGIITNSGGKVIVKKMPGQNVYKGSNSNGVRSLSLPKWRESFVVSGTRQRDMQYVTFCKD